MCPLPHLSGIPVPEVAIRRLGGLLKCDYSRLSKIARQFSRHEVGMTFRISFQNSCSPETVEPDMLAIPPRLQTQFQDLLRKNTVRKQRLLTRIGGYSLLGNGISRGTGRNCRRLHPSCPHPTLVKGGGGGSSTRTLHVHYVRTVTVPDVQNPPKSPFPKGERGVRLSGMGSGLCEPVRTRYEPRSSFNVHRWSISLTHCFVAINNHLTLKATHRFV